jgi:hypothetical protein
VAQVRTAALCRRSGFKRLRAVRAPDRARLGWPRRELWLGNDGAVLLRRVLVLTTIGIGVLGCSSTVQPRAGGVNPCSLVSASDVSSGFYVRFKAGHAIVATADGFDNCSWQMDDPNAPRTVQLRIASDQSLQTANSGFFATSVPPCRTGCPSAPKLPPLSAAAAYRADFAANPTRWLVRSVPGLGDEAKVAWMLPEPGIHIPAQIAAHTLGGAQLDVLSGKWLISISYTGPAAQSADVSPALQQLARQALRALPQHVQSG